jgi:hypothetical protein
LVGFGSKGAAFLAAARKDTRCVSVSEIREPDFPNTGERCLISQYVETVFGDQMSR